MAARRMPDHERTDAGSPLEDGQERAQLFDDLQNGDARAERVGGNGEGQTVRVQALGQERVELPVAALPVAAMDVDDKRRIAVREEQVVAVPAAGPVRDVELG